MEGYYEIEGFPDYMISPEDSEVWSHLRNNFLKQTKNNKGYLGVTLMLNGIQYPKFIHALLGEQFIHNDDPVNKISVDHINQIRTDNRLCNLRWATKVEQQQNRGMMPTNTSGHICVSRHTDGVYWIYKKVYNHKHYTKTSKNLSKVLCYKFITILKIKVLMR